MSHRLLSGALTSAMFSAICTLGASSANLSNQFPPPPTEVQSTLDPALGGG
jgi:hypothetical protein